MTSLETLKFVRRVLAGEAQDTVDLWESLTEVTRDEHLVYAIDAALNQEKTQ